MKIYKEKRSINFDKLKKDLKKKMGDYSLLTDEAMDEYFVIEIKDFTNDVGDKGKKVEVRAELNYDDLMDLASELDKVIDKYDPNAYFEAEQPGIISAVIW